MDVNKTASKSSISIKSYSENDTLFIGQVLAGQFKKGTIAALFGELGSGKTTLVRGIASGLGVVEPITSPTYTIMNCYPGTISIYHFDFYRLSSNSEFNDLGLDDYFYGDGLSLIEWPDRIFDRLPQQTVEIHLQWTEDLSTTERKIELIHDRTHRFDFKALSNKMINQS